MMMNREREIGSRSDDGPRFRVDFPKVFRWLKVRDGILGFYPL